MNVHFFDEIPIMIIEFSLLSRIFDIRYAREYQSLPYAYLNVYKQILFSIHNNQIV